MHKTRIDLSADQRAKVVDLLNARLADVIDLGLQTKQAHWNVKGPHFIGLHEMFDEFYEDLEEWIDIVAERAVTLGGVVDGTVGGVAKRTKLPAYPTTIADGIKHVEAMAASYSAFAKLTREAIDQSDELGDADTADMFTDVSRDIDKKLWMLEAHLQAER